MILQWTPNAIKDLHAIYNYIAADSPQNALQVIDRITNRDSQILKHPWSGRKVPEMERDDIRELIESPYRIIYHVDNNRIIILTVMHGSRILRDIPGIKIE